MSDAARVPILNMKAVMQETGLKADTLRAWERRYGFPQPERSEGGHRLYSQRDVEALKWLVARQHEGMSISNAVELWHQLAGEGQDPLETMPYLTMAPPQPPAALVVGEAVSELREAWLAACLDYDERQAEQVLAHAFALYPPEQVCGEVLQAGLARVGEGWYQGQVTVQQEHFASALAVRRLEALIAAAPAPTRQGRILVGCPPQENHVFGPLLFAFHMRRRGWDVVYLGADVPLAELETALAAARLVFVVFSAQQLFTAATLLEVAQLLSKSGVPLGYGGLIFNRLPALRARIPGHFLGERLDVAPQAVEQLLASRRPAAVVEDVSREYRAALLHFGERLHLVEAQVWEAMREARLSRSQMQTANANFSRDITAALTLGDMAFLDVELDWIEGLLVHHKAPAGLLSDYLAAYYRAVQDNLGERGQPITARLAQLLGL